MELVEINIRREPRLATDLLPPGERAATMDVDGPRKFPR
jgi:hypothetical protein